MEASGIPTVYIAVAVGVAIWFAGQKCGGKRVPGGRPSKLGKFLSLAGLAVFALALYAGFRGPVTIAGVTLETFPFAGMAERSSAEALSYARKSLVMKREPALGWHGASKTALKYTVQNNGDRKIARLVVRFSTTSGSSVELPLRGPFPAKQTSTAIREIPPTVSRAYFTVAKVSSGEIVGARF